jgi:octaprenyl-diphosphate synthase
MVAHIQQLVANDFAALNSTVIAQLHSEVPLIESIGHYITEAGGKRMRPVLVLLTSNNLGYTGSDHIELATVIEFLHTATLLHDDVVDMSEMRRGRPTANTKWDNPSSVLVGDFIYSRAFELLVNIGDMAIMDVMASTTNKISEGEVLQLVNQHNPQATEADYMQVIRNKTAILFAAACKSAAILAGANESTRENLHNFGLQVGMAFQLVDDVLDYSGSSEAMGKNVGDDLSEGKPTLPLIYVMQHGNDAEKTLIESAIRTGASEDTETIMATVKNSGALEYTKAKAVECIDSALQCLDCLPENDFKNGLAAVADAALNRES